MATKLQKIKWDLYHKKEKLLLIYGLKNGLIKFYDEELISRLRNVYYGGVPASIILLSNAMSNGCCYDRALLMARAFLEDEDDVQLIYATINSLKLNPNFICDYPLYADHCILERTTKDGRHLIYDTSNGLIYDKSLYWLLENPKVRKINNKESIKRFIEEDKKRYPEDTDIDKYATSLVLPMIENTFGMPNEIYFEKGIELLQREIAYYKNIIKYNEVVAEINQQIKRLW